MAELNPCVKEILCALSGAVLNALNTLITAQKTALVVQVTAFQAQLLTLDVATAPAEIARGLALDALNTARSAATLVPIGLITACVDLGDFNVDLVAAVDGLTADLNDTIDDLNRLLSFKEELQFLVNEFLRIIDQFSAIQLAIQECGQP